MINFIFKIKNPFPKDNFVSLWTKNGGLGEFKNWEFQISYYRELILGLKFDTSWCGQDHAGPEIEITIFGITFNARIYDSRHWNYKTRSWQIYE